MIFLLYFRKYMNTLFKIRIYHLMRKIGTDDQFYMGSHGTVSSAGIRFVISGFCFF